MPDHINIHLKIIDSIKFREQNKINYKFRKLSGCRDSKDQTRQGSDA